MCERCNEKLREWSRTLSQNTITKNEANQLLAMLGITSPDPSPKLSWDDEDPRVDKTFSVRRERTIYEEIEVRAKDEEGAAVASGYAPDGEWEQIDTDNEIVDVTQLDQDEIGETSPGEQLFLITPPKYEVGSPAFVVSATSPADAVNKFLEQALSIPEAMGLVGTFLTGQVLKSNGHGLWVPDQTKPTF